MSGDIKQASQEKDLSENQSAECKAIAPEQSAAESGEEGSGPSWKDKQKIKTLEEIDAQQKKQIEALTAELKEAETALTNQKTKNFQLNKTMVYQVQKIRDHDVLKKELKKELKEKKVSEKAMSEKLEKEEENLHNLSVKFRAAQKEGCKVNLILQQERRNYDRKEAELEEEITRLNNEGAGMQSSLTGLTTEITEQKTEIEKLQTGKERLGDKFFQQEMTISKLEIRLGTMDTRIGYMQLRYKADEVKNTSLRLQINEYKKAISESNKELKKTQEQQKAELQSLTAQLESYRAECERRGEINEADKETKANMKMDIRILYQQNALLRHELTSGFIACYRAVKRFFWRAIDAIRLLSR